MLFELILNAIRPTFILFTVFTSLAVAQAHSGNPGFQGEFTRGKAMNIIYGNYRVKSGSSTVKDLSDYAPALGNVAGVVRIMLDAPYSEDRANYRVLVTYALPRNGSFNCHPCAPSVSAFVFQQHGGEWLLKNAGYDLRVGGTSGQTPPVKLTNIGPSRHGLTAKSHYIAPGDVTGGISIFIPLRHGFAEIFNLNTVSDNLANCKARNVDCERETSEYEFIRNPAKQVWDIRVTEREVINGKVITKAKTSIYEFRNDKYEHAK